ncbi:MAG TPA: hypothetical protein VMW35_02670 [Myxococcota bacterium]|nr:hypothetical protein [Myxococcota bacterium]
MKRRLSALVVSLLVGLAVGPPARALRAEPEVPEALRPWVPWVLQGHDDARCPTQQGAALRVCAWPSRLALDLDAAGGRFAQDWRVYGRGFVPLPGGAGAWPEAVKIGERDASVLERNGRPVVWLEPGAARITGAFVWRAPPPLLAVPPESGLVALRLDGVRVTGERREPDGRLWLGRPAGEAPGEPERVTLDVRRLVRDGIPLELETRLDLDVAGPSREVRIAGVLLPGFVPMALDTPLPARLEAGGDLVVQARPGHYAVTLEARHEGPADELALPVTGGAGDGAGGLVRNAAEPWAFEARPSLRVVEVEGAPAIDPQQTTLPPEWRGFPTFLLEPGSHLRFVERRRGDSEPAPDALALRRHLWLDFDGGGYTAHDRIEGRLHRSWRLEASPVLSLGRVAVRGVDQPVTMLPGSDGRGVEVRDASLEVEADARLEGVRGRLPAIGWRHDFADVAATLELPPGWRLLFATGVDDASPTWVGSWSLLDLFLVLVIALGAARLLGLRAGVLALAALVLSWMEPWAPRWLWAAVLAAEALVRVLPAGGLSRAMRGVRLVLLVALVVATVGFLVTSLRAAFYPVLERPYVELAAAAPEAPAPGRAGEERLRRVLPKQAREAAEGASRVGNLAEPSSLPAASPAPAPARYAPDPTIPITTGPGVPDWRWQRVALEWRGPVKAEQEMGLALLPPRANLVLAWLRAALVAALVLALLRAAQRPRRAGATPGPGAGGTIAPTALVLLLAAAAAPRTAQADLPTPELLEQLEQRLLAPPPCAPECASLGRLRLEATPAVLRLRLEASAEADVALPLPGGAGHWLPEDVLLDGAPAQALRRGDEGTLWIALPPGAHQIVLQGATGASDAIDLPLPLRPQRVESALLGFTLEGVRPDGRPEGALRLVREAEAPGGPTAPPSSVGEARPGATEAPALPPFFHVERTLSLGLRWEVTTVVARATPPGVAASLAIPLLPGESVTAEVGRVENGRILVNLGPGDASASWRSVLEPAPSLALASPRGVPWVETWRIDASPVWHVEATGIPPILDEASGGVRQRTYRPWPGESVSLAVTKPVGIEGATLTIDRSRLEASPGRRATDATLELVLRSSRGGQHAIALPDASELLEVQIDGRTQPLRLEAGRLLLPLEPRSQAVKVRWREARGASARFETPRVDLAAPSVNATVVAEMPRDRWVLFVFGPRVGPAILFWSALAVLVPLAFGLARTGLTPLGVVSWFLLGVGLTQVPVAAGAVVAGWLLALGWRGRHAAALGDGAFRLSQIGVVLLSLAGLAALFFAIQQGLLGLPEMQIAGNGSAAGHLVWYQDRATGELPRASVLSVPLWVYRGAMLAWALWLAVALMGWLRWGWEQLGVGGYWRRFVRKPRKPARGEAPSPAG